MAIKNATYKIYTGSAWDEIHFKTSASQVNETNLKVFLRPGDHTVNGKPFGTYNSSTSTWTFNGITLYATDIKMSDATDASKISEAINDLHASQDTISGQLDSMSQNYEGRIADLEAVVNGSTTGGGSLASTYELKTDAAAKLTEAKGYTDTQIANLSSDVDTRIAAVIGEADQAYDTLQEIAEWIQSDTTGAAAMSNKIATHTASISELETNMADVIDGNPIVGLSVSGTTITYALLNGTTKTITTQDTTYDLSGAVSTITKDDLTANKILFSNDQGKVAASATGAEKLQFLNNANQNITNIYYKASTETISNPKINDIWISY